ncbi:DMT family transporter [Starkeya sp. ORNL1]|uniref:DMT family transporter n=1 Tax=Starkeya sp. ORNL1 TaxID=2709380 RepID=UPI001463CE19|nr:DMT family transporter [Starkeya sp. ORNL1]QJP16518.1 DMT family transporter [Starkeya sp. ORNL1]
MDATPSLPPATLEAAARRDRLIGIGAALFAVSIWGAWIVATRHAVSGHLPPAAAGWLRFVVTAVVLAPAWWRIGLIPKTGRLPFLFCFMGSGVCFFLVVGNAMRFVPAADVGPLLPGTMPLVVAVVLVAFFGERLSRLRMIGFACIALGVLALGGRGILESHDGSWRGHLLLLTGAVMWSGYTIAFPRAGMSSAEIVGLIGIWSLIILTPFGLPPLIAAFNAGEGLEILVQLGIQGVGALVALLAFGVAIEKLGSSRAAAFTGLVPPLAALIAVPVLGEHPDAAAITGIVATGLGVALASGAISVRRPSRAHSR